MLNGFHCDGKHLHPVLRSSHATPLDIEDTSMAGHTASDLESTSWIDLQSPTPDEIAMVEQVTGLHMPNEAELSEIESSSRLSFEDDALYLSMPMLTKVDGQTPQISPLGFVVTKARLITIRFTDSRVFDTFASRLPKLNVTPGGVPVFVNLLEAIVDRLADVLEMVRANVDSISFRIFREDSAHVQMRRRENLALQETLKSVGRTGDLISRIGDSLLGVGRIIPFAAQVAGDWTPPELKPRFKSLRQDVASLNEFSVQVSNKVQFLLDAVLGLINIAQNNIIKVLTVVSVVGVPPTLVASIYGMNFKSMPELDWAWGYPYGLTLIVISAILPLLWFIRRGWL